MPEKTHPHIAPLLHHISHKRRERSTPFYIALDGRSGSGKSTLASHLQSTIGVADATIIEGDTFYRGGSGNTWDKRSPAQNARAAIDWRRLGAVLKSLQTVGSATWRSFDWHSELWDQDNPPLQPHRRSAQVRNVVIVEGVYSARPELAGYYDTRVLLDVPFTLSRQRARIREADAYHPDWSQRWSAAETTYFSECMPRENFDLVLID